MKDRHAVETPSLRNESFVYRLYDLCAEIERNVRCTFCVLIELKNLHSLIYVLVYMCAKILTRRIFVVRAKAPYILIIN